MAGDDAGRDPTFRAGVSCTDLIARPSSWINRRVETVELLSHEETRRRVSIDFTLSDGLLDLLTTADGIVAPISVLTKEPRRNFDLRDESGSAVPVLGRVSNAQLTRIALLNAALDALPDDIDDDAFGLLAGDLGQIVTRSEEEAEDALAYFVGAAENGDQLRASIWNNATCRTLLETVWANYVLYAALPRNGPNRRILKYSYGDDFHRPAPGSIWERLALDSLVERAWTPDRSDFIIRYPGASRAASFHAEIVIPEELRIEAAFLFDFTKETGIGNLEEDVNRASLHAPAEVPPEAEVNAIVEVAPERHGRSSEAASTGVIVASLLWLGVISGLDSNDPGAAVSLLLAGAALFSGVSAVRGQHELVQILFSAPRRWLALVSVAALTGSATLAMQIPNSHPTKIWGAAAIVATIAALRLLWSAIRAAS